jgi:hypothetical protein
MSTDAAHACRRREERIPLPVEIVIVRHGRNTPAIVRDISYHEDDGLRPHGLCILHHEPFTDAQLHCRTAHPVRGMPSEFQFAVRWTRCFENEAWLTGGEII